MYNLIERRFSFFFEYIFIAVILCACFGEEKNILFTFFPVLCVFVCHKVCWNFFQKPTKRNLTKFNKRVYTMDVQ